MDYYTKLLLVEDGSVMDGLGSKLESMGILVVTYRQGARPPELVDLITTTTSAVGFTIESEEEADVP